jgi:hypothetical protein
MNVAVWLSSLIVGLGGLLPRRKIGAWEREEQRRRGTTRLTSSVGVRGRGQGVAAICVWADAWADVWMPV